MRIRRSVIEDAAELARLHKGTIRTINKADYSPKQIEVWSKRTNAKRFRNSHAIAVRYVVIDGKKIVGFSDFKKEDPETFWGLYVHKDHLGKGIGSLLMQKMEDVARKMGIRRFILEATTTARTFYEKQGFRVMRKSTHAIEDQNLDIFIMEKKF